MATVVIKVANIDITADVLFETARFEGRVNGQSGDAFMRVRDNASTYSFAAGADWLVTVDGSAAWRGFVTQVSRVYIAPAENVADTGLQRFFDLRGSDLNILFTRRTIFNQSDPTITNGPLFAANTADTTAITSLLTWLDLSADDLDTTGGVVHVAEIDPSEKSRPFGGAQQWADGMTAIAAIPAAIWYIRPESGSPKGTLVYCDADVPTSPFGLSDQPNHSTTYGYREAEIVEDATAMANDVLGWGMGYGSAVPVFNRTTDGTSLAAHGRWQSAVSKTGVYVQGTINRIVDSIVNGSPAHHRGAKDDRPNVTCVTYQPGLLAGYIVTFTSNIWGWSMAIPVRQMTITFESPDAPKYELLLSFDIDTPWTSMNPWVWKLPGITLPSIPPLLLPPLPSVGGCDCGFTDDFTRADQLLFGTSTASIHWATGGTISAGESYAISTNRGAMQATASGAAASSQDLPLPTSEFDVSFILSGYSASGKIGWINFTAPGPSSGNYLYLDPASSYVAVTDGTTDASPAFTFTGADLNVRVQRTSTGTQAKLWYVGSSEPAGWDWAAPAGSRVADAPCVSFQSEGPQASPVYITALLVGDLTAGVTIDRCTESKFDDFNRTVAVNWGNASSGGTWTPTTSASASMSVNGSRGLISLTGGAAPEQAIPVLFTGDFDMTALFQITDGGLGTRDLAFRVEDATASNVWICDVATFDGSGGGLGGPGLILRYFDGTNHTVNVSKTITNATDYMLRWTVTGTTQKVKLWLAGTTEPGGYDLTQTGIVSLVPATLRLVLNGGTGMACQLDSIDFDYAGRPCYWDCSASLVFDDFNRTVSNTAPPFPFGAEGTGGWGTAPSGPVWIVTGSGPVRVGVDGSSGTILHDPMAFFDPGDPSSVILGADAPPAAMPNVTECLIRFWTDTVPDGHTNSFPNSGTDGAINDIWALSFSGGSYTLQLKTNISSFSGTGSWGVLDFTGGFVGKLDWLSSTWYNLEVLFIRSSASSTLALKLWADGDPDPGWMMSGAVGFDIGPFDGIIDFFHDVQNTEVVSGVSPSRLSKYDSIMFGSCVPVAPGAGSLPVNASGYGCEVATRSSSTVYSTTQTFVPNGTAVWLDGLFQRRGTDYTEDSGHQSITFTSAVASTSSVRICYFVAVVGG